MGKGDKKSRRGKIWRGTYGVRRPHKTIKALVEEPVVIVEKPVAGPKKSMKAK